jgi:hypothetical protein
VQFPSAKTNEKAAETLKKFGIPVSEKMLRRSDDMPEEPNVLHKGHASIYMLAREND